MAAIAVILTATGAAADAGRYELVPGPLLERGQFLFRIDTETGRTWWTVLAPSQESGKMFVSDWHLIPEQGEATPPAPAEPDAAEETP